MGEKITVLVSIFGCKLRKRTLVNLCGKFIHWNAMGELTVQREGYNHRFRRAGIRATQDM